MLRVAATRKAVDSEGWLDTGDIACVDADGFVYIKDRCEFPLPLIELCILADDQ